MGNVNLKLSLDENCFEKIDNVIELLKKNNITNVEKSKVSKNNVKKKKKVIKKEKKIIKKEKDELDDIHFDSKLFDYEEIEKENKQNKHIAIFIDGENISSANCLNEIKKFNIDEIEIVNVYGVNKTYYRNGKGKLMVRKKKSKWEKVASEEGYNFIENSEYTMKNSLDMKMNCDIMKCLYQRKHVTHYILVTSDNDFRCLIEELHNNNKKITGITCNNNRILWKNSNIIYVKKRK